MRTPSVLQIEATECGAASLAMILGYFGRHVTLEELRVAMAVSRDGVSARRIVEVARTHKLSAGGQRRSVDQLNYCPVPFIAFMADSHFLVVEAIRSDRVRVNDPGSGRRWIPMDDFRAEYSGIVLHFAPTEDFEERRAPHREHPLAEMLALARRSPSGLVAAFLAGMLLVVPTVVGALLTSLFVEQVLDAGEGVWVGRILAVATIVAVATLGLVALQQRVLLRMQTRLSIAMSWRFVDRLLRLPMSYFSARYEGGLVTRIELNSSLAQLVSVQLTTVMISLVTMTLYAVVLLWIDTWLGLLAIVVATLNAVALTAVARQRIDTSRQVQVSQLRLDGRTYLGASQLEDIKATGADQEFFEGWTGNQVPAINTEQRYGLITQALLIAPVFLSTLSTVAVLGVGGWLVIDGRLNVPQLIGFQVLMASFLAPINALVAASGQFQDAQAWLQQVDDVFNEPVDPVLTDGADDDPTEPVDRLEGSVELRNVTFGYTPGAAPAVDDVSVRIAPGQRVAIVGRTGSGKSTLASLVAGLYQPWSGEILFDGRRRHEYPAAVMTSSLAKVDQSIMLFAGSIAENVRLWDDTISAERMIRAVEDAAIAEELFAKRGGLSYELADSGRNLSGGQRQRLEIARALAGDPTIVVLDEATSALDPLTEERIDQQLRRRGCTCLIIAHRLSTIRDCDQILVLDGGVVAESGTHDELIANGSIYPDLVAGG
ncbi:MAG: cysteine peptidase family C39 domain-containing protein [Actinomycetota bacterium]